MNTSFNPGDIVCLTFDSSKRFIAEKQIDISECNHVIVFKYFNEHTGKIEVADVPTKYLRKINL